MAWIGVLDCNNFFVSCERLFRPDLRTKPVVVLSSNDGCIVARSQEIKDSGIPMGVPYFQVKDKLTKLGTTVFSSHFALYRDISRRVFAVMREELALVEQYSIDEGFFCVEHDPEGVAHRLKVRVEQAVGIPVSIGVAASKTQAKYVNQVAKKTTGVVVWSPKEWAAATSAIQLGELWGVGSRLALRYRAADLVTVADVLAVDTQSQRALFGLPGARLQQELRGQVAYPVTTQRSQQKSLMSSRSFARATTVYAEIADAVAYHVRQVAADLRAMQCGALSLRVSIRPSRHGAYALMGGSQEVTFSGPVSSTVELLRAAATLLAAAYRPQVPYQKASVLVGQIAPLATKTRSLFVPEESARNTELDAVVDAVNSRWGRVVLEQGRHTQKRQWQPAAQAVSPAYTTQWPAIATAYATNVVEYTNDTCI